MTLVSSHPQIVKDAIALAGLIPAVTLATTSLSAPIVWLWNRRRPLSRRVSIGFLILPSLTVCVAGLRPAKPPLLAALGLSPMGWLILLATTALTSLVFIRHIVAVDERNVFTWLKSWAVRAMRPSAKETSGEENGKLGRALSLPAVATVVAGTDLIAKFYGSLALQTPLLLVQVVLIAGTVAIMVEITTAKVDGDRSNEPNVGTLRFSSSIRYASLFGTALALSAWASATSSEARGDLRIVDSELPKPQERILSLTLANRANESRVLTRFAIEVQGGGLVQFLSKEFDIPTVAEYDLSFKVDEVRTDIKASPQKQFPPNKVGKINIALTPDFTGGGAFGRIYVRVLIYSETEVPSATKWFTLEAKQPSAFGAGQVFTLGDFEIRFTTLSEARISSIGITPEAHALYAGSLDEVNAVHETVLASFRNAGRRNIAKEEYIKNFADALKSSGVDNSDMIIDVISKILTPEP